MPARASPIQAAAGVVLGSLALAALVSLPAVSPLAARWMPLAVAVAAGAAAAALLRRSRGAPRAPWVLMGLALVCSFVGWAYTAAVALDGAADASFKPFADVAYFAGYGLFVAGLAALLLGTTGPDRVRRGIDVLALSCTLAALAWVLVLRGLVHDSGLPTLQSLAIVAYPALDLALVAALLLLVAEARPGTRASLALLATGGVAIFLGDLGYAWSTLRGGTPPGAVLDIAWLTCYALLALAARYRVPAEETLAAPHPRVALAILFVPIAALLPVAVLDYSRRLTMDAVLFGIGVVMVTLLALRQALMFLDLHQSSGALRATADDLRRQKAELARSETTFRTLAENFPDCITRVDREGRRVYANPATKRLWASMGAGDPVGTLVADATVTRQNESAELRKALAASLADGRRRPLRETAETPQGVRHLEGLIVPERGPDGQVDSVLLVARDVTETHDAYTALRASEERYRLLAENASDLVQLFDANGVCQYASPSSATVLGYLPEELVGHDGTHLLHPEDAAALRAGRLAQGRPDGSLVTLARARRKDGSLAWVETVTRPRLGSDGRPAGFVAATRDVTARHLAQERFRLASKATTDVIWDYDVAANQLTWGESMEAVFGHRLQDLEPSLASWSRRIHADDHDAVSASFAAALAGSADKWNGAYRFQRANGEWADVLDRCFIVRDADGKAVRAVGSFNDITDLRRAEREREAAVRRAEDERREGQRLKEMAQFKTQFLNNAAHELVTPLTPLKLQLATLAPRFRRLDPPAWTLLERNVDRLGTLAKDLLDAARLESGALRLDPRPVRVADLIAQVAASFRPQAQAAGLTLGVHPARGDLVVDCDEMRVEQVLFNLVHNALKFTPRGGQVWLQAEAVGDAVTFQVRDTGTGLDAGQIARLFQPFVQVHDASMKVGGTGLGLYIAQGIARQHGGDLSVQSDGPGRGSTFLLRLPAKAILAPAAAVAPATAPRPSPAAAGPGAR